jgi:acetate---CoA ligase (ADP-forming)
MSLQSGSAARFANIGYLIEPKSVAIIGASADATRIGGRPINWMLKAGFGGAIYPVNPNRSEIQGLRAYESVLKLPEAPDAAVVAVPAALVLETMEQLGALGTRAAIVFSSGFAEVGGEGVRAQAELGAIARRYGMRVIGPNSLGLFNGRIGWYPTFTTAFDGGWPRNGGISVVSQSGAFGSHLATLARNAGLGAPLCVMTGNEADVSVGDLIGWLAEDPNTDVIAAYMEGIKNGPTLMAGLEAARQAHKPVVLMKVGRSEIGSHAARSHTASIAGDDAVADAIFEEFGVVRARSAQELLDIAYVASKRIYPARNTLGVITVSGGAGVLISDAAEELGVAMPALPEKTQDELRAILPFAAFRNPVDCTAHIINDTSLLDKFLGAMMREGDYKSVACFFAQIAGTAVFGKVLRDELMAIRRAYPDRLFVLVGTVPDDVKAEYEAGNVPVFEDATRAMVAIAAMGRFGDAFARAAAAPPPQIADVALPPATPSEADAKRLLASCGIPVAEEFASADADAAAAAADRIGYPVVMKILSPDIQHKTEIGGVVLGVADAAAVRANFGLLVERARKALPSARIEGVIVARQIQGGVECIAGIHNDPVFGPIAMFGLGGIFAEVIRDVVFRRCPFGEDVAREMIGRIRGAAILNGARGRPAADIDALARLLSRLSVFAAKAGPKLAGIDLNPVVALPRGQGAYALDALIEIAGMDHATDRTEHI